MTTIPPAPGVRAPLLVLAVALLCATASAASPARDGRHAFDYQFGEWNVRVWRLLPATAGIAHWVTYTGTHTVMPLWNGRANVGVMEIRGAAGLIEGLQLRLYNPSTRRWSLSFASSADGELQAPMTGSFHHGIGEFRSSERIRGKTVLVRSESKPASPSSYTDTIARSYDGGRSWIPVWIATYRKRSNRV
ncbi:MAG TPA: hypothetical protein VMF61_12715 [Candidatus Acidoferrales bacterium]|nr:hypothetical protein [Candidatus Acidoferrales bacterium]